MSRTSTQQGIYLLWYSWVYDSIFIRRFKNEVQEGRAFGCFSDNRAENSHVWRNWPESSVDIFRIFATELNHEVILLNILEEMAGCAFVAVDETKDNWLAGAVIGVDATMDSEDPDYGREIILMNIFVAPD